MNNSQMINILTIALILVVTILFVLIGILVCKSLMKRVKENNKDKDIIKNKETEKNLKDSKEIIFKSYTRESIYKFMEFDKVEDNMIIQKQGKRFLMVVECQGVNYDLMSKMEKIAVEEGFLQFLNALRHPIQIYVQSRTINLGSSIETYKAKVEEYKTKLNKMNMEYEAIRNNPKSSEKIKQKYNYEITKQKNLYEYGKDIIENTEKMNLNKNVLNKKYYVIIPYYSEEANNPDLDNEEIKNLAFSELYTRAQSVIRTLYACEVKGRILNSTELIDLLHVSYNRDESEVFDIEKAIELGCEDLYSTAPDVFEKKIKALDEVIYQKGQQRAEEAYEIVKSTKQEVAEIKEQNIDELINEMAKKILEQNQVYIGKNAVEKSKEVIDNNKKSKGGRKTDETKKTRRNSK